MGEESVRALAAVAACLVRAQESCSLLRGALDKVPEDLVVIEDRLVTALARWRRLNREFEDGRQGS